MKTMKQRLLDFKAAQMAGTYTLCPRCGCDTMKPDLYTNALSRMGDIMVCDTCGVDEAKLAFMQAPGTLASWACMQPLRPDTDFKHTLGKDAWRYIQNEQASYLVKLYERWLARDADTDLEALRLDAYETCEGLTTLWFEPFQANYEVADGTLVIRFRKNEQGVQLAADVVPG